MKIALSKLQTIGMTAGLTLGLLGVSSAQAATTENNGKWCGQSVAVYDKAQAGADLPVTFTGTVGGGASNWNLRLDYITPVQRFAQQGERPYQTLTVQELHLRGSAAAQSLYKDFAGRHVSIAGLLKAPSGAGDSDVVLEADQIQAIGPTSCNGQLLPRTP